ncbi:MAG: hypothetical protein RLZZ385_1666 [Pseudomonadota bacterium]|jgi:hypothetical protein
MQYQISELGFKTSDEWTVQDFYTFFHQLNILYNRIYVLDELLESRKVKKVGPVLYGSLSRMDSTNQLLLESIEIHSPGEFNLKGVSGILKEFREFWKDVSYKNKIEKQDLEEDLRHKRNMNTLEEADHKQEIVMKRIRQMVELGYEPDQIEVVVKALGDPIGQLDSISKQKNIISLPPNQLLQSDADKPRN